MLGLFLRFLRFGCLAFGGPVAQIAMLKHELVEREKWVTPEEFNRALAVYQVLPGPEASELCVWFGYRRAGRVGGFLAGLGFLLPGFLLMLAAAFAYVRFGAASFVPRGLMSAMSAVVAALIVRAVFRIGRDAVRVPFDFAFVAAAFGASLVGVPFPLVLAAPALSRWRARWVFLGVLVAALLWWGRSWDPFVVTRAASESVLAQPGLFALALLGIKAGLLTFGGAYTAVPIVRQSAVIEDRWLPDRMLLDGLAIGGVLPAPLIIFTTFVGYLGGGVVGAVLVTACTFAPAFLFTLVGHGFFERVLSRPGVHALLDGVVVGVVGLIAATAVDVTVKGVRDFVGVGIFVVALAVLFLWKSRWATAVLVAAAVVVGVARQ